ncbi:MAG: hypothetical protein M3406_11365 [Chloroflexota bacterium]|nr:hypothetical protein [Chloroflexota bacterium]
MHKVAQFVAYVRARVEPREAALVRRLLPDAGVTLFESMPVADRRHALDVAGTLTEMGIDDRDVLGAALLHDAAKGHRMRLWHRVAGVLLEAALPSALRALASPDTTSWRHPFHLYLHHAPMSAALATEAGCAPRVADFIRGEVSEADAQLLRALGKADDAS